MTRYINQKKVVLCLLGHQPTTTDHSHPVTLWHVTIPFFRMEDL